MKSQKKIKKSPDFGDNRPVKLKKKIYLYITELIYKAVYPFTIFKRKKKIPRENIQSILVILLDRIGDAVLTLPFIETLGENFPGTKITLFVNTYSKDIYLNNPNIHEIIQFDKKIGDNLIKILHFFKGMRKKKFDFLFDLTSDYRIKTAILSFLIAPSYSIGYNTNSRGFLFNKPVPTPKKTIHQKDVYLKLLKAINLNCSKKNPKIHISRLSQQKAENILKQTEFFIPGRKITAICPGGFYPSQCWSEKYFARAADVIFSDFNKNILLLGGPSDAEKINRIAGYMESKPIIAAGTYRLEDSINLLSLCCLVICNNSGLLHISAALSIPTISLLGPTVKYRWLPLGKKNMVISKGVDCSPCNKGWCDTHDCMNLISIEEVIQAVNVQMQKI